jgi:pimeloyl-ACP methyl ester carboxylesterase
MKRKISLLASFALAIACATYGFFSEKTASKNAWLLFPPAGTLIDIGGRNIHLNCKGEGKPIVVFESGYDTGGSLSWALVHKDVAQTTRACTYDRAGMMWSEPRPSTDYISKDIAKDLHKTLNSAGEYGPYVLVGHSFGGPYITIFTKYFSSSIAGLVFVDTSHPDQIEIFKEYKEPWYYEYLYQVMDFFEPAWAAVGLTRYFANLNDSRLPNQSIKDENTIDAFSPNSGLAPTLESQFYEQSLKEAGSFRDFGNIPLYVIGAIADYEQMSDSELSSYGLSKSAIPELIEKDVNTHRDQASWSSDSQLRILKDTHHYVQFDKPKEVIKAIRSTIEKVRNE